MEGLKETHCERVNERGWGGFRGKERVNERVEEDLGGRRGLMRGVGEGLKERVNERGWGGLVKAEG